MIKQINFVWALMSLLLLAACNGNGLNPKNITASHVAGLTWVNGSDTVLGAGIFGSRGIPAEANVPGARASANQWRDSEHKRVWLFSGTSLGGGSNPADLNDLWMFDEATEQWTWITGDASINASGNYGTLGVTSPSNYPRGRSSAFTWMDTSGNLWMFGGVSQLGKHNDLWKYDPLSAQWTWMAGSSSVGQDGTYGTRGLPNAANIPGARFAGSVWLDANSDVWLFGGYGNSSGGGGDSFQNDLWKYHPATSEWTWVGGSSITASLVSYGTKGVSSPSNQPGPREFQLYWNDGNGLLWMYGGQGLDSLGATGYLNDMWTYNTLSGDWTWVAGSNTGYPSTVLGTLGIESADATPGGTAFGSANWIDGDGYLWFFGGEIQDSTNNIGMANDLWRFNPRTMYWTRMNGGAQNQAGNYGTKGLLSPSNIIGSREALAGWMDYKGQIYLFGGYGNDSANNQNYLGDFWKMVL